MSEDSTQEDEAKWEALREMVGTGIEELDRGEGMDGEDVFDEILEDHGAENGKSTPLN